MKRFVKIGVLILAVLLVILPQTPGVGIIFFALGFYVIYPLTIIFLFFWIILMLPLKTSLKWIIALSFVFISSFIFNALSAQGSNFLMLYELPNDLSFGIYLVSGWMLPFVISIHIIKEKKLSKVILSSLIIAFILSLAPIIKNIISSMNRVGETNPVLNSLLNDGIVFLIPPIIVSLIAYSIYKKFSPKSSPLVSQIKSN